MKKAVCVILIMAVLVTAGVMYIASGHWYMQFSENGIQVDWDDPWITNGETLYYGMIKNADETITARWLRKDTWELIMEARSKGLMVSPM